MRFHVILEEISIICRTYLNRKATKPLSETCFMKLFNQSVETKIDVCRTIYNIYTYINKYIFRLICRKTFAINAI